MFLHTFYTWIVANLLHLLFLVLISLCFHTPIDWHNYEQAMTMLSYALFFSLLYSSPGLLIAWGCLYVISYIPASMIQRFLIWLLTVSFLVIMELLIIIGFDSYLSAAELLYGMSSVCAVVIAIVFRFSQFRSLIHPSQPNEHEPAEI
jgi:hypothetical protein